MKKELLSCDSSELAIGEGERADTEVNGRYPTRLVGFQATPSRCFKQIERNLGVLRFVSLADRTMTQRVSEEN